MRVSPCKISFRSPSRRPLELVLAPLGRLLGALGPLLSLSWPRLGHFWACLGVVLGLFRAMTASRGLAVPIWGALQGRSPAVFGQFLGSFPLLVGRWNETKHAGPIVLRWQLHLLCGLGRRRAKGQEDLTHVWPRKSIRTLNRIRAALGRDPSSRPWSAVLGRISGRRAPCRARSRRDPPSRPVFAPRSLILTPFRAGNATRRPPEIMLPSKRNADFRICASRPARSPFEALREGLWSSSWPLLGASWALLGPS